MKRHLYDHCGATLISIDEAEPVCGEDFCEECGDCLACYWEDPCYLDVEHRWVQRQKRQTEHEKRVADALNAVNATHGKTLQRLADNPVTQASDTDMDS